MKPSLRRALYTLIFIGWLAVLALPALAFILAARGEIQLGDDPQRTVRLFLVDEEEADGLGLLRTRPVSEAPYCVETRVRYLLWSGRGESATSCQCYADGSGTALVSSNQGRCPAEP